jgi:hypothetical protein
MAFAPVELSLNIFGPVCRGGSFLNGFAILVIVVLGLAYIPFQLQKMSFAKQWPKLVLEVVVLLFLVFVGIATIAKHPR